ncbi:MAG: hypothetical protein SRB2_04207 [Desulfobacteraceae bacterium Eth-SRB2]|nr:MAG: hypothetical protein SRB2_04207 [Desulfobacteraceae bacterium Eth-SRB2]
MEVRDQPPAHRGLPSLRAVGSTSRKPACMPYGLEAAPVGSRRSGIGAAEQEADFICIF